MPVTRPLLGEFTNSNQLDSEHIPKRFVAEIQDAMRFEGLKDVPLPLQKHMDRLDNISTHDLSMMQFQKDIQAMPIKMVLLPMHLSSDE